MPLHSLSNSPFSCHCRPSTASVTLHVIFIVGGIFLLIIWMRFNCGYQARVIFAAWYLLRLRLFWFRSEVIDPCVILYHISTRKIWFLVFKLARHYDIDRLPSALLMTVHIDVINLCFLHCHILMKNYLLCLIMKKFIKH